MHGLMRGHQRRGDGRLERDTRLKREKRCLLTSPGRNCAGVLLYKDICPPTFLHLELRGATFNSRASKRGKEDGWKQMDGGGRCIDKRSITD
jgi:hypothetical protein